MFDYRPLDPGPNPGIQVEGELLSPVPFDRMFTDNTLMLANCVTKDNFERKVKYVDDPSPYYKDAVNIYVNDSGGTSLKINSVGNFAAYKRKEWSFQSEFRFVLVILPSIPGIGTGNFNVDMPNHVINAIGNSVPPAIDYFDVELSSNRLNHVMITTGPLCSEGDRVVTKALVEKYTDHGVVTESALSGMIRQPMR